jgi:uncharacterized protein YycO
LIDAIKYGLLWIATPFQKFLQRIGRQESLINADQVDLVRSMIQPGDILLSYEKGRPTSWLIKGFYDHAAIVSQYLTVVEAVGDRFVDGINIGGVREVGLDEWLYKKDSVCVLRPIYMNTYIKKDPNMLASEACLGYVGKPYDYTFKIGSEKIYCSELVYLCYVEHDSKFLNHVDFDEILPIDYYQACLEAERDDMFMKLIIEVKND